MVTPEQALAIKPFGLDMKVLRPTEGTSGAIAVIMASDKPGEGLPDYVNFSQETTGVRARPGACQADRTATLTRRLNSSASRPASGRTARPFGGLRSIAPAASTGGPAP
jgi:hypothetical protein